MTSFVTTSASPFFLYLNVTKRRRKSTFSEEKRGRNEGEIRGLCFLNFIFFMAEWFMIYYFASTIKMLYECDKNVL